jgi:hypothetical protein
MVAFETDERSAVLERKDGVPVRTAMLNPKAESNAGNRQREQTSPERE